MARFEVQMVWHFSPGRVDGSTEMPPDDILDENGRVMNLAQWPKAPLVVEARGHGQAVEEAISRRRGSEIFVPNEIGIERVKELTMRKRPGDDRYTSVIENWLAREEGESRWRIVSFRANPSFQSQ